MEQLTLPFISDRVLESCTLSVPFAQPGLRAWMFSLRGS